MIQSLVNAWWVLFPVLAGLPAWITSGLCLLQDSRQQVPAPFSPSWATSSVAGFPAHPSSSRLFCPSGVLKPCSPYLLFTALLEFFLSLSDVYILKAFGVFFFPPDRVLLCHPGLPQTPAPPPSPFWMLGLLAYATTPTYILKVLWWDFFFL